MGILRLNNLECLKKLCIFSLFCCCCVEDISIDLLEEQVLEERDLELNEEEDTRMEDSRE